MFFIYGLTKNALIMIRAGIDMVKTLINGIAMNIEELVTSGKDAVLKFLEDWARTSRNSPMQE